MTPVEKNEIDNMTHEQMCHLHRFAPVGHKYFTGNNELVKYFAKKYQEYGGMTPEISKRIGW